MPYSRNNLKKALAIVDSMESLLEAKDRMSSDIEVFVDQAANYMKFALAKMQVEAGVAAREEGARIQPLLPLFQFETEEAIQEDLTTEQ